MINVAGIGIGAGQEGALDAFSDDLEEGGGVPYCQVVNPKVGMTSKAIEKDPDGYGLIVPIEQAEQVGFKPDENWKEVVSVIVSGDDENEIPAYLTHNPQFIVVSRSQLEVQSKAEQGWRYVGLGYENGNLTEHGQLVVDDTSNPPMYRYAVRYLLVFIGADGKPLHDKPLALTGHGGFGGSFGKEVSTYFSEFNQAYAQATKKRGRLNYFAQAFVLHSQEIGFHKGKNEKGESTMAYTCISGRISPTAKADKAGEKKDVERRDRTVTLHAAPVGNLMFPKDSEVGQQIAGWYSEYKDFAKPNKGRDGTESKPEPYEATGEIDPGSLDFQANGNAHARLIVGDTQQKIVIPPSQAGCLDSIGQYIIKGLKTGGTVVVESYELASGPVVAASQEEIF